MKKQLLLTSIALVLFGFFAKAQKSTRIGYVDMEYILENVAEYQEAQSQLDAKVAQWEGEIKKKQSFVDQMKMTLENERVLLTQELITEREEEIKFVEQELFDYQEKRFGPNGDLMIQRSNLVEPVQDQVFNAVQEIGKARQYDMILDKSADLVMLYANERNDVSDQVLLSINRSSKRKQVNSKADRKDLERTESRNVEQEKEVMEREQATEALQDEREKMIDERKAQREAEKEARAKEFEERRQKILDERQQRKDSITNARNGSGNTATPAIGSPAGKAQTAEERREQILKERQRRKDSILGARQKIKDSIQGSREKNKDTLDNRPPRPTGGSSNGEQ